MNSNDRRGLKLLVGMASAALALGACTGERIRGSGATVPPEVRAEAAPVNHDAYAALGYRLQWRGFPTMSAGASVRYFDVLGDLVVVQESASILSALETTSGAMRWSGELGNPLTKFVGNVRDDGRIISASETDVFYLDTQTGNLLAKHGMERVASTRPLVHGNLLIFGTPSGQILAYMGSTGYLMWGNSVPGSLEVDPVPVGDAAGVVSSTGDVLIFDSASGLGRGRNRISGGPGATPGASDTLLFVASLDQSLYAFDSLSARELWRHRTDAPLRDRPVHHEGRVYCATSAGMVCFESATGRIVWTSEGVGGHVVGLRNGRLLVWDLDGARGGGSARGGGTATTLDPATGQKVESARLPGISFLVMDQFVDGNLYTATPTGVVAKFTPR